MPSIEISARNLINIFSLAASVTQRYWFSRIKNQEARARVSHNAPDSRIVDNDEKIKGTQ